MLELKSLEEVNKYSSPSSILVVNLISVERMDSAFLFLLLAVFSGFNCLLSAFFNFEMNKEGQRLLSGSSFDFKEFFSAV
jgi:anti-anti-sigma regulatory factor